MGKLLPTFRMIVMPSPSGSSSPLFGPEHKTPHCRSQFRLFKCIKRYVKRENVNMVINFLVSLKQGISLDRLLAQVEKFPTSYGS